MQAFILTSTSWLKLRRTVSVLQELSVVSPRRVSRRSLRSRFPFGSGRALLPPPVPAFPSPRLREPPRLRTGTRHGPSAFGLCSSFRFFCFFFSFFPAAAPAAEPLLCKNQNSKFPLKCDRAQWIGRDLSPAGSEVTGKMAAAAEEPRRARCWGRPAGPTLPRARPPPARSTLRTFPGSQRTALPWPALPGARSPVPARPSWPRPCWLPAEPLVCRSSRGEEAPLDWFRNPSGQGGCVCTRRRLWKNTPWWCCNDGAPSGWRFLTAGVTHPLRTWVLKYRVARGKFQGPAERGWCWCQSDGQQCVSSAAVQDE